MSRKLVFSIQFHVIAITLKATVSNHHYLNSYLLRKSVWVLFLLLKSSFVWTFPSFFQHILNSMSWELKEFCYRTAISANPLFGFPLQDLSLSLSLSVETVKLLSSFIISNDRKAGKRCKYLQKVFLGQF